jgi:hypothetical protein
MIPELATFLSGMGSGDVCELCFGLETESTHNVLSKPGVPWMAHPTKLEVSASDTTFNLTCFISVDRLNPELFSFQKDGRDFLER